MLRPDPAQRHRPIEIRDDLIARITEAEQEGWLGEIEGLQVSLASEEEKLPQLESERERQCKALDLGMPTFSQIATRTNTATRSSSWFRGRSLASLGTPSNAEDTQVTA
jgi:hypothetical protein